MGARRAFALAGALGFDGALAAAVIFAILLLGGAPPAAAQTQTPLTGHYPPGQSGLRGAAAASPGWSITNFSRFFSNLEVKDAGGETLRDVSEARYANITMITWVTNAQVLGMQYGMLAGIPFSTGNLNPSAGDLGSKSFGLGDVLLTPVSLYGRSRSFDTQLQFTVWSASGRFTPGSSDNRGSGFWALVYSLGGVWYPGADRANWSMSAIARLEQNFEQEETGIDPGHDLVVDWGVGKTLQAGGRPLEAGISGFATWQLTEQEGGENVDTSRYRYFGVGPEASLSPWDHWTMRLRVHTELGTHNTVQGNNVWFIVNYAW